MRLQLLSDVHVEFHKDGGRSFVEALEPHDVDVLVLAGDIAVGATIPQVLALFCRRYCRSTVVYVHGNHEFYGSDRDAVIAHTQKAVRENANLVWLDAMAAEIAGRRILGAPMWFRRNPDADGFRRFMADFSEIRGFESWVYEENRRARAFFEEQLGDDDIVVTHHLPSHHSVAPRFASHPLNPFFVCELEGLIHERRPRLWLHGHTHTQVRCKVGATDVLCNPFGYAGTELNSEFSDRLIVEL